jgi:hypothetical protein
MKFTCRWSHVALIHEAWYRCSGRSAVGRAVKALISEVRLWNGLEWHDIHTY